MRSLRGYGFPRSLLALTTLSVIGANPPPSLFVPTPFDVSGMRCGGLAAAGLWCLAEDSSKGQAIVRWLSIAVLAIGVIGWRPSWTCLPHWYVTASLAMAMPVPSGADYVAQIMTMLLVPVALGDSRRWHWGAADLAPRWEGAARAALLATRVQLSVIYLAATAAKLQQSEWRDGTALPAVVKNPHLGLPDGPASLVEPLAVGVSGALLTWTVLILEVALAVLIVAPAAYRRLALVLGTALHGAIAVLLGLPTFALAMIAALALGAARGSTLLRPQVGCDAPHPKESPHAMAGRGN